MQLNFPYPLSFDLRHKRNRQSAIRLGVHNHVLGLTTVRMIGERLDMDLHN